MGGRDVELTEFLLARIAEDEAVARQAGPGHYHTHMDTYEGTWVEVGTRAECSVWGQDCIIHYRPDWWEQLVDRFDPARVLAQCEAVRRIVELETADRHGRVYPINPRAVEVIRALATIWRDHPDFDPAWEV